MSEKVLKLGGNGKVASAPLEKEKKSTAKEK